MSGSGYARDGVLTKGVMMIPKVITLVIAAVCMVGCGSSETQTPEEVTPEAKTPAEETPVQAIAAIIQLYEARDFDALIRTRYAEISKAENEQQVQKLIDRFATLFQGDDKLKEAISTYRSVLQVSPELSEDGTVATFKLDGAFVKLSQMPDGKWGFHL